MGVCVGNIVGCEEKCVFLWRRTENEKEKTFEEGKLNGDNHPTTS